MRNTATQRETHIDDTPQNAQNVVRTDLLRLGGHFLAARHSAQHHFDHAASTSRSRVDEELGEGLDRHVDQTDVEQRRVGTHQRGIGRIGAGRDERFMKDDVANNHPLRLIKQGFVLVVVGVPVLQRLRVLLESLQRGDALGVIVHQQNVVLVRQQFLAQRAHFLRVQHQLERQREVEIAARDQNVRREGVHDVQRQQLQTLNQNEQMA